MISSLSLSLFLAKQWPGLRCLANSNLIMCLLIMASNSSREEEASDNGSEQKKTFLIRYHDKRRLMHACSKHEGLVRANAAADSRRVDVEPDSDRISIKFNFYRAK